MAFDHAFAGRTFGSLSMTWDDHYRGPFQPLLAGVSFAPTDDPSALDRLVTGKTAAIIVEPIQGEGGVRPMSPALAKAIEKACAADRRAAHRRRDPVRHRPHRRRCSRSRRSA